MWNPAFSSYTWERFKTDQEDMCDHEWGPGVGNGMFGNMTKLKEATAFLW